ILLRSLAGRRDRIVEEGTPSPRAELVAAALLGASALSAAGFVAFYALDRLSRQTQLLALALGLSFAVLAAACLRASRHLEEDAACPGLAEGGEREALGAAVVPVRLGRERLRLAGDRRQWARGGIVAYSKICTHAGCAVALYRSPNFEPTQPRPALVCPCHY